MKKKRNSPRLIREQWFILMVCNAKFGPLREFSFSSHTSSAAWQKLSYLHIVVIPDKFVIVHPFLFSQCFWFHFSAGIVQLTVFSCVDLVKVERETLTILQTDVETLFPVLKWAQLLKNITNKRKIPFHVGIKREGNFLARATCTVTVWSVNPDQ